MALTVRQKRARNAVYQARWRERRDALARSNPEVVERGLIAAAERCGGLSEDERTALADRLQDAAMRHFGRMHELNKLAIKVRAGEC
jgi:hypothetical protein